MVSQKNIPLSQDAPETISFSSLFKEWLDNHQLRFEDITNEEISAADRGCEAIRSELTSYRPKTAQELAIQILVETEHGSSDWRNEFFFALIDLANRGSERSLPRTINPTTLYQPTINMDGCSTYELRRISDLLWAASELINAAISDDMSHEAKRFLDDLQALINLVPIRIAEQSFISGPPAEEFERRNWSWIIARGQIQCAEGEVHLEGPGVPDLSNVGGQAA